MAELKLSETETEPSSIVTLKAKNSQPPSLPRSSVRKAVNPMATTLIRSTSLKEKGTAPQHDFSSFPPRARTIPADTKNPIISDEEFLKEICSSSNSTNTTLHTSSDSVTYGNGVGHNSTQNAVTFQCHDQSDDQAVDDNLQHDKESIVHEKQYPTQEANRTTDECSGIVADNDERTISTLDASGGCDISGALLDAPNVDCCKSPALSLKDINGGDKVETTFQNKSQDDTYTDVYTDIFSDDDDDGDDASAAPSEAQSEASMMVLWRYMGLSKRKYMTKPPEKEKLVHVPFIHDLQVGDHVIRWKMLGYCYPIQVHGIVFSVGPEVVTIIDCGLDSFSDGDKVGSFDDSENDKKKSANKKKRRRMNVLTLCDEKEIKKWTKVKYGQEVELKIHSTNNEMQQRVHEKDLIKEEQQHDDDDEEDSEDESNDRKEKLDEAVAGLEIEEVEKCKQARISPEKKSPTSFLKKSSSCFGRSQKSPTIDNGNAEKLRMPQADPPKLVLARLRFLLEHGEEPWVKKSQPNLLPPHHLLYANSECIAVFCKTGRWSTLQASIFLHSSTVGNAKQTATVAAFLSAQSATVPASGLWGFFGGTTTVSLFTAQPWLVPALVGGGAVYVGLPMLMLWKAKERWRETEKRLNNAFMSMYDSAGNDTNT